MTRGEPAGVGRSGGGVEVVVLGVAQDGGVPHAGCRCARCAAARRDPALRRHAACLAIVDRRRSPAGVWLIDATPDVGAQLDRLADALGPHPRRPGRLRQPDGVFLTHAHLGHIGGLPFFGPEAMAAEDLPVYAAPALAAVVGESAVWRALRGHLAWRPLAAGEPVALGDGLAITPLAVPHRDEMGAGTFGFLVEGPARSLLYVPDIDRWEAWPNARARVAAADVALLDGTFTSADEIGGRPPAAHPLAPHTLEVFAGLLDRVVFIHLNHTNPLLDEGSAEREAVAADGAAVAEEGEVFGV